MNPFFFGSSDKQLFGVHHPPEGVEVRDAAVLLCPSIGHEYMAAHGSLTQLGNHLARQGMHVLRFDFYGTGDSAGDIDDSSLEQWIEDVDTAAQELRDTSGARKISAVGLRLGASIASMAGARGTELFASVLWEPVVTGADFIHDLETIEEKWLGAMYLRPPRDIEGCDGPEVMGHLIPQKILDAVREIDLMALSGRPAERILLMQNTEGDHLAGLQSALSTESNGVAHETVLSNEAWFGEHWATLAMPPVEVIREIAQWMRGAYS